MNRNESNKAIGELGEYIARQYVSSLGYEAIKSEDEFDEEKDFYYEKDGQLILAEVKTQQPFVFKEMFSYGVTQIPKCNKVDELYIVSIPPLMSPGYKYGGLLFKAEPKKKSLKIEEYTTKSGKSMIGFPIRQEGLSIVAKLSTEMKEKFLNLAYSDYK